jgi:predicted ribosome quality control (RQC) complex YloA/Tae2 family protein
VSPFSNSSLTAFERGDESAGQLAVYFSKRRGAARADVTYTSKKFVRKGRGKAGPAIVERHKTLVIDHDPRLLAALLGKDIR